MMTKKLIYGLSVILFFLSCKNENKVQQIEKEPKSITKKIANAHGFEQWKNVSEVQFTFQVDVDTVKGNGRTWLWKPKTNAVSFQSGSTTYEYNRNQIDSTVLQVDRAFINDKFWAFIPFQLVWDKNLKVSEVTTEKAPISNTDMQMITIVYPSSGGYTPGDAYDIYFDDRFIIREWTYRKNNSKAPMLSNTFENYKDFNGIKIAIDHKKDNGKWNLNFTDVKVSFKD